MAVGIVAILWLCAPLFMGLMMAVTSRVQYNAEAPRQVGTLSITNAGVGLSLWTKQRPRAICYEGEYWILQVSRQTGTNEYYALLPSPAGDDQVDLSVYWLPVEQCIRLVDTGKETLPRESVVDLRNRRITDVERDTNGVDVVFEPRNAMTTMAFPKYDDTWGISSASDPIQLPTGQALRVGTLYRRTFVTNTVQRDSAPPPDAP